MAINLSPQIPPLKKSRRQRGIVYLVGAGPGDPGLLTVKGQALLRQADVVVYDHLVSPAMLRHCQPAAKHVYVGKERNKPSTSQRAINVLLIREARKGKMVVRLKGGDPFVFGRGGEEALELVKAKVAYEVVPGVTSAIAVPAYAGIPVTHRDHASSLAIVTGHEDPTKPSSAIRWEHLAKGCDTIVCLMGVATLPGIVAKLRQHGRSSTTPCAVIAWGTWTKQRTVVATLGTIAQQIARAKIQPPAVLVVGTVVSLRKPLAWFESKPLMGRRILVTRASDKAAALTDQLEALGAEVEQLPAIELVPVASNGLFRQAIALGQKPDWVFFTSPEGIGWFANMLKPHRQDVRWLAGCHIGAIGAKTAAAIEAYGVHVDFVPKQFSQEGMVRDLSEGLLRGKRALIFSAEGSRDVLETGLRERGALVMKVPIYRTIIPQALIAGIDMMMRQPFDWVTITSASCVDHLSQALEQVGKRRIFFTLRFASIGPVTSATVRAHGGRVAVEAKTSTIEGLVEALIHQPLARGKKETGR